MKSKADIIACLEDEIKWRDKVESTSHRFDTFEQFIHQGWCEALEWVLSKTEKKVETWICNQCNYKWIVDETFKGTTTCLACEKCEEKPDINFIPILQKGEKNE